MLKATTAKGPSLSHAWEVAKKHAGAYSGGAVALSHDGQMIACLCGGDVAFLNVHRGEVLSRLKGSGAGEDEEEIVCFVLHPFGGEIVTASRNLLLRHWDIASRTCKRAIKAHEAPVMCMDYDRTGTLVATGSADRTVKVWDIARGFCTHNFRDHGGVLSAVRFHPDPAALLLATGSEDCHVRLFDLSASCCVAEFGDHLSVVTSLSFAADGATMLSGARDQVVCLWDVPRRELLKVQPVYEAVEAIIALPAPAEEGVPEQSAAAAAAHRGRFAIAGDKGVVRVFSYAPKVTLGKFSDKPPFYHFPCLLPRLPPPPVPQEGATGRGDKLTCRCVATQPSSTLRHKVGYTSLLARPAVAVAGAPEAAGLIAVTQDHNFILMDDARTLRVGRQVVGYNDEVIDVRHVPGEGVAAWQGQQGWVAVATNSPQVRLFGLDDFSVRLLDGHADTVLAIDVSPDGRYMSTVSKDKLCLVWDLESGRPLVRCAGHADAVSAVALSRKSGPYGSGGAFVVTGGGDKTIKRWDLPIREMRTLSDEFRAATAVADAETDDAAAVGGSAGGIETRTLQAVAARSVRAHDKDINAMSVAPNDTLVATASQDRTVKLWRARDLELVGTLRGHKRGVWRAEFSPVDRCVATCSADRTVKLWSATDFSCLKTFQGHTASVLAVQFIAAGMQLMSAGADGLLKLWTIRTNECDNTFDAHEDKVWALAVVRKVVSRAGGSSKEAAGNGGDGGGGANVVLEEVVTGGADSVLKVWRDVTEQEEGRAVADREQALLREQELSTAMAHRDHVRAIDLALELRRPQRLWHVLKELLESSAAAGSVLSTASAMALGEGAGGGRSDGATEMDGVVLDAFVRTWSKERLALCLSYCRDWNTNAKKAVVAQALLSSILRCFSIDTLKGVEGCATVVDALLSYSQRHFDRVDRLAQASFICDYTLTSMQMLLPMAEDDVAAASHGKKAMANGAHGTLAARDTPIWEVAESSVARNGSSSSGGGSSSCSGGSSDNSGGDSSDDGGNEDEMGRFGEIAAMNGAGNAPPSEPEERRPEDPEEEVGASATAHSPGEVEQKPGKRRKKEAATAAAALAAATAAAATVAQGDRGAGAAAPGMRTRQKAIAAETPDPNAEKALAEAATDAGDTPKRGKTRARSATNGDTASNALASANRGGPSKPPRPERKKRRA
ncbi:unnamed protein product [Phaeothamnion confervicola]